MKRWRSMGREMKRRRDEEVSKKERKGDRERNRRDMQMKRT